MRDYPPPTRKEMILSILGFIAIFAVMGGIIYLAAISPPSDNSSYMEMMP